MSKSQVLRLLPLAILLGGFALRLYHLGADSLWYDETVSLFLARSDIAELTRHTAGDIHPPLYYYLLHFWGQAAGWSEFAAAYFSLCFGVILIALVYRASRDWFNLRIAVLAASLVALSPYNVWYSQEVRMYTLGAALGLASVYFLLRMLRAGRLVSRDLVAYVIITTLGIYTLYYFVFLLVFTHLFFAIYVLRLARHPGLAIRSFILSQLAIALLYLPWLPIAFRQATDPPVPPWRSFISLPDVLRETLTALLFGQSVEPSLPILGSILVLGLLTFVLTHRIRHLQTNTRSPFAGRTLTAAKLFLFSYTFVPLLAIFVFSLWKPLYHVRYIFTYSPGFYILLALALEPLLNPAPVRLHVVRRAAGLVILVVLALGAAYSLYNFWFDPRYAVDDLRGAVRQLADRWRPGDAILVNAGYAYPALTYYFPEPIGERMRLVNVAAHPTAAATMPVVLQSGSIDGSPRLGWGDPRSDFYATDADETRAALDRVFAAYPRLWVLRIYDTVTDPRGVIRQYLAERGQMIDDQVFSGESNVRVQGFLTQRPSTLPASATRVDAKLGERMSLLGAEVSTTEKRAGDFYDAVLYWTPLQSLNYNYQSSFQVLDSNGKLVAQSDETPLGTALPTTRWRPGEIYREPVRVHIPANVSPGDYVVIVKLYNPRDGEVLGEAIQLAQLHISA